MTTTSHTIETSGSTLPAPRSDQDSGAATSDGATEAVDTEAEAVDTAVVDTGAVDTGAVDTGAVDPEALDTVAARSLWEALIRARADSPVISAAEDAVFRFYLPLARATARSHAAWGVDPDLAEQAAELGLANAVLAWRRADIFAFAAFARGAIRSQIRLITLRSTRDPRRRPQRAGKSDVAPEGSSGAA